MKSFFAKLRNIFSKRETTTGSATISAADAKRYTEEILNKHDKAFRILGKT